MLGLRSILIGALTMSVGLVLMLLALFPVNRPGVAAGIAVMLGGGAVLTLGVVHLYRRRDAPVLAGTGHRSAVDIDVLIRSMVAVAAADRIIAEGEVVMIEDVSAGLLGEKIPRWRIEQMLDRTKGRNAVDLIARAARQATPEGIDLAVKGAVWAGRADGALTDAEGQVISAIAARLGVSGHRLRQCIAEADHVYDRLAAHDT
jgi:uncharacterized tellurite resistance protein B-like protein